MTPSKFNRLSLFKKQCLATVALVTGLSMGDSVQAQVVNFYASETAGPSSSVTLLDYSYNAGTSTLNAGSTYSGPSGLVSGSAVNESSLQLSGDGNSLSYAGFVSGASSEALFNLSTLSFDPTLTTVTNGSTIRSSYTVDGSAFYVASGTTSPAYLAKGTTSETTYASSSISGNSIAYNGGTSSFYITHSTSGTTGGVYTSSSATALTKPTSTVTYGQITGTGWFNTHNYDGIAFLGANTLFAADTTANSLTAFTNAGTALSWNQAAATNASFSSGAISTTNEPIRQLSVEQLSATSALIFFTTGDATSGHTSTLDEVSYNTTDGFGTVNTLASSTTEIFTGVAAVSAVPEPGTYATFGLGLGALLCLMVIRRKKNQGI